MIWHGKFSFQRDSFKVICSLFEKILVWRPFPQPRKNHSSYHKCKPMMMPSERVGNLHVRPCSCLSWTSFHLLKDSGLTMVSLLFPILNFSWSSWRQETVSVTCEARCRCIDVLLGVLKSSLVASQERGELFLVSSRILQPNMMEDVAQIENIVAAIADGMWSPIFFCRNKGISRLGCIWMGKSGACLQSDKMSAQDIGALEPARTYWSLCHVHSLAYSTRGFSGFHICDIFIVTSFVHMSGFPVESELAKEARNIFGNNKMQTDEYTWMEGTIDKAIYLQQHKYNRGTIRIRVIWITAKIQTGRRKEVSWFSLTEYMIHKDLMYDWVVITPIFEVALESNFHKN